MSFPKESRRESTTVDRRCVFGHSRRALWSIGTAISGLVLVGCLFSGLGLAELQSATAKREGAVRRLRVVEKRTPRFPVPRFATRGTYPGVQDERQSLRRVNGALLAAVLADERAFASYARREKKRVVYKANGIYATDVRRDLTSASTVVVSTLVPTKHEVF